jgi:hypothetical protein
MKMKTFSIALSGEATMCSPTYKIKAKTSKEAYEKALKKFIKVVNRIHATKWFEASIDEINVYTMSDEDGNNYGEEGVMDDKTFSSTDEDCSWELVEKNTSGVQPSI